MEIKIGVQHVQREIVIETEESTNDIKAKVSQALQDKSVLELENTKGAITLIPAEQIGYIELGAETKPRIGFGFSE
ncbi:DUF3107 domain-containing protein [Rothia amarae]|uniref:DUF3107 domain-containing protein n=1 Tax=Rothia amarae TaxID=169480 RepID=A0A7H2BLK6_9MICC|nr:DUF3107 domain-containing protein [Rothia amarae]QNV40552.1 DUF3107 domain-containing protein [Rothia amarae]SIJ74388.1 Conserved protein of uncharacterised function, TB9.4 [Mycobacteroides abscessus subsp. abscessus]